MNTERDNYYEKKYIKYKQKYMNLKQMTGGEISYECKDDAIKCDKNKKNYELCVKKGSSAESMCDNEEYKDEDVDVPTINLDKLTRSERENYEREENNAVRKGYISDNLTKSCKKIIECASYENSIGDTLENFSIITLNVMGICREDEHVYELMKDRVEILKNYLVSEQPDILCFQEMSEIFLKMLYKDEIKDIYRYCYEEITNDVMEGRNKDIEVCVLSKFKPKNIKIYELGGNLGYSNSLGIYEYNNVMIFNCYMQAGSDASVGQKHKWLHYSRCRSQQLMKIKEKIDELGGEKEVIVLGDFNFNINEDEDKWPEKRYLNGLELNDVWITGYYNPMIKILDDQRLGQSEYNIEKEKIINNGLTENTDINSMRFNGKFIEKKYRQ